MRAIRSFSTGPLAQRYVVPRRDPMTAAVVGGSQIVSGLIGADAASSAASQQASAAEGAQKVAQNEFNTITAQQQPFVQAGYGALSSLESQMGLGGGQAYGSAAASAPDPSQFMVSTPGAQTWVPANNGGMGGGSWQAGPATQTLDRNAYQQALSRWQSQQAAQPAQAGAAGGAGSAGWLNTPMTASNWQQFMDPSYQFQLNQGQQALQNSQAAQDGVLSGGALKSLINYNQNMAQTGYTNAVNLGTAQQNAIYGRLAGLANLGQNAATNTGQQGTALAGLTGNAIMAGGAANAAGTVGAANALSGAVQSAPLGYYLANQSGGAGSMLGPATGVVEPGAGVGLAGPATGAL